MCQELMHMRRKTQVYLLIVSAIVSLMAMAMLRSTPSPLASQVKPMSAAQRWSALEELAVRNPAAARIIEREKATQEASEQAAEDTPK
jgi:hypothetical protein